MFLAREANIFWLPLGNSLSVVPSSVASPAISAGSFAFVSLQMSQQELNPSYTQGFLSRGVYATQKESK